MLRPFDLPSWESLDPATGPDWEAGDLLRTLVPWDPPAHLTASPHPSGVPTLTPMAAGVHAKALCSLMEPLKDTGTLRTVTKNH